MGRGLLLIFLWAVAPAVAITTCATTVLKPVFKVSNSRLLLKDNYHPFHGNLLKAYLQQFNERDLRRHRRLVCNANFLKHEVSEFVSSEATIHINNEDGDYVLVNTLTKNVGILSASGEVLFYWKAEYHEPNLISLLDNRKIKTRAGASFDCSGFGFGSRETHYDRHRFEFAHAKDALEYEKLAIEFARDNSKKDVSFSFYAGAVEEIHKYNPETQELLILRKSSRESSFHIMSYYKVNHKSSQFPRGHDFASNLDYVVHAILHPKY